MLIEQVERQLVSWAGCSPELAACLDAASPAEAALACCADDPVARFLVARAQLGDAVAGQLVLGALTPELARQAGRVGLSVAECLGAAWERILAHPVESRPVAVIVSLASDAVRLVRRENAGREVATGWGPAWEPSAVDVGGQGSGQPMPDPDGSQVLHQAQRDGWVSVSEAPVLRSVYLEGLSGRQAAERHRISPDAVRARCSSGVKRLRGHRQEILQLSADALLAA